MPIPEALAEETVAGPAAPERLEEARDGLARFWMAVAAAGRAPSQAWRDRLDGAVLEVVANVLRHAYPPGHKGGNVKLRLRLYPDRVEALVTDRGIPFEEPPPAPEGESDVPAEPGGLARARAAVDYFEYSRRARGSNRWVLSKRLRASG